MRSLTRLLAGLFLLAVVILPTPAHAGGGCSPATLQQRGNEVILESPSGMSQIHLDQVNLNVTLPGGGKVWDLPGNPTQVRWFNELQQPAIPGMLTLAVSQPGCDQPTLLSQPFPPTMWRSELNSVWRVTGDELCASASIHQTTVWDPTANAYNITLAPTFGNYITQISSTFLQHGTIMVTDHLVMPSRGEQVTQFDLLIPKTSTLEMRVEATTPERPTFLYGVNTICGGWSTRL